MNESGCYFYQSFQLKREMREREREKKQKLNSIFWFCKKDVFYTQNILPFSTLKTCLAFASFIAEKNWGLLVVEGNDISDDVLRSLPWICRSRYPPWNQQLSHLEMDGWKTIVYRFSGAFAVLVLGRVRCKKLQALQMISTENLRRNIIVSKLDVIFPIISITFPTQKQIQPGKLTWVP